MLDINNINSPATFDFSNNDDLSDFGAPPHLHENAENTDEAKVIATMLVL
jgi:hypothetical protein